MIEVILGSLAALAIRDIIYELYNRYTWYQRKKNAELFVDYLEDLSADDD